MQTTTNTYLLISRAKMLYCAQKQQISKITQTFCWISVLSKY